MARTKGAKGKRQLGTVRIRDDDTLVPVNAKRMRALLVSRPLLPLTQCGADRSQLRRLRDGKQASMRFGRLKALAKLLDVPAGELIVTSGAGETGGAYRVDVTARALAQDCWRAGGQAGAPPFWLVDLIRSILRYETWAGAFLDGGVPILSIDPERGGRRIAKALARLEARREQFCDLMAELLRLVLPSEADLKAGVRVNPRRAGALLAAFRNSGLTRLHNVSYRSTAQIRRKASEAADAVLGPSKGLKI
jgi:hypothetical protein